MEQPTPTGFFKSLSILFRAMLTGQVLFIIIAYVLVVSGNFKATAGVSNTSIFLYIAAAFLVLGNIAGSSVYRKKLTAAQQQSDIPDKLSLYRGAFLVRCALAEFPVLFGIISFMITNAIYLLAISVAGLVFFMLLVPVKQKICIELGVDETDLE